MHIHMTANHLEHLEKELGFRGNEYAAARWYLSRFVPESHVDSALDEFFKAMQLDPPWSNDMKGETEPVGKVILYPDGRMLQILQVQAYKGMLARDIETKEEEFVDDELDWEWM